MGALLAPPRLRRRCACAAKGRGADCPDCARPELRRHGTGAGPVALPGLVRDVLASPGQPLAPGVRRWAEPGFGWDFSRMVVHSGAQAEASARAVGAVAYAAGDHVVLPPGYDAAPLRPLVAHELAHVVQANGAPASAVHQVGDAAAPEEAMADAAAARVLAGAAGAAAMPARPALRRQLGLGCGKERPPMNTAIIGVFEHQAIEGEYEASIPSAEREFSIPGSGGACRTGAMGWADLANPATRELFEIKPDNPGGIAQAEEEVACYVQQAMEHCGGVWRPGMAYFDRPILDQGDRQLWARLGAPGAIVYRWQQRQRSRAMELAILLAIAAALAAAARAAARKLADNAGGPVEAFVSILAAVAVLALGEREAKAGTQRTDDDPLVALAQVLTDTGRPMPPEIEALLREHPELRTLVELEAARRRRAGGATAPGTAAGGTAVAAPKPPAGTTPGADGQASPGQAPGRAEAGGTATSPSATAPLPAQPAPAQPAGGAPKRATSEAGPSYWANLQLVLDSPLARTVPPGSAQLFWPPGTSAASARPGQKVIGTHVGQDKAGLRYAFQLEFEVVSNQGGVVQAKVTWGGPMLLGDGRHLAAAPGFAPGRTFPIKAIAE